MRLDRLVIAVFTAVATSIAVAPAQGAEATQAALAAVNCTGTSSVTYSPAITPQPTTVTATSSQDYLACVVLDGGSITFAEDSTTVTSLTRSCATLLGITPNRQQSVEWNTGQISQAQVDVTTTQVQSALVVTSIGTVISGPFTGLNYKRVSTYANVDALLSCQSPQGLSQLGPGVSNLTITPLI
ncbi:hypothetical protein ACFXAS_31660 [Streptomyces sp. NPDC059459]|uniref:hypothetical protein n=1 Tax=Streptomyces sp. NPDC059459 TaxID=3346839 RepID=UPI0036AD10C5